MGLGLPDLAEHPKGSWKPFAVCVAVSTLRHANLLNGGLAFATAKIHPSLLTSFAIPPLFLPPLVSGGYFSNAGHPAKNTPPCSLLRTPRVSHVGHSCRASPTLVFFASQKMLRSVGRGVRRPALICLMVNSGQVFATTFLKKKV